jgi:hypothetical protein
MLARSSSNALTPDVVFIVVVFIVVVFIIVFIILIIKLGLQEGCPDFPTRDGGIKSLARSLYDVFWGWCSLVVEAVEVSSPRGI